MNQLSLTEVRVIVYSFLFLLTILTFGILRLFNAVVNFTRLGLKLKESISLLEKRVIGSDKNAKQNSATLTNALQFVSSSINDLRTFISSTYDRISRESYLKGKSENDEPNDG